MSQNKRASNICNKFSLQTTPFNGNGNGNRNSNSNANPNFCNPEANEITKTVLVRLSASH